MNLYNYIEKNVDETKIQSFEGDEYELAIIRYILIVFSKIFYRNRVFFLNDEQIKERELIYVHKINPNNVNSFEIVCSSYCNVLKEILKNRYNLKVELIETDRDVFKHVALLLFSKTGNKYFIDPLMDLSETKAKMKSHNFASNNKNSNPYIRIKIDNLSFLDDRILEKIDNKIGYIDNYIYTDNILYDLKNELKKIESFLNENSKKDIKIANINFKCNDILELKILSFFELIRKKTTVNGLVDSIIYVKTSLMQILNNKEKDKIKIFDFFVDACDLKDKDICGIIDSKESRKRGLILEYNNKCIVFSDLSTRYLKLNQEEWKEKQKENNIFVRRKETISLYKHLSELELEPNILDHREFLRVFKKIEETIIRDGKNTKDYINVINRKKIDVKYHFWIEFSIENNLLVLLNKKNNRKFNIIFEDEGRNVKYTLINF
ncbi:MAG: hypothetical protein Q4G09_07525 [Clostridia bacterium]|nr:hypothetical protein [Clostridia bacterium]